MSSAKTVVLKGRGCRNERIADGAITPGHLVEIQSTGKIKVHDTAGGFCQKAFAVEDDLQGNPISTAYTSGARVQYNVMLPGDQVNALIKDGENIAIGDKLVSAGDGTLKEATSETADSTIVAIAVEACDMSGSSGADPSNRCAVEIV
jgi:hypothetical protein